jgi:large subunit ribosomal protein L29
MKASKIREMSTDELKHQEFELTKQLFHLRFQLGAGQLESARKIASVRKDLARIKTIQNELRRARAAS